MNLQTFAEGGTGDGGGGSGRRKSDRFPGPPSRPGLPAGGAHGLRPTGCVYRGAGRRAESGAERILPPSHLRQRLLHPPSAGI